jgi:hypothetical protein
MKQKSFFNFVSAGIMVLVIGAFILRLPLPATSPAESQQPGKANVHLLGIIDPDDRKYIWALPTESGALINRRLAARYPRKTIDGIIFFRVHSWRDTANVVLEAHAHQGELIVDIINRIERIHKSGPNRVLTRRVAALEKRIAQMTDSGYR